jgi:hypothetical protein
MKLGFDTSKMVQFLIVGAIVMFALSYIIDLNAFGKGLCSNTNYKSKSTCEDADETWDADPIFKEDVDYSGTCSNTAYKDSKSCQDAKGVWTRGLIGNIYVWILVAVAVIITWNLAMGGTLNRKRLVGLIVMGIMLFVLYNYVLAPQLGLDTIEFAAYQLQAMMP